MNLSPTVTPQECQHFPKIQGKRNTTKRKSCGSALLTNTPYKTALEEIKRNKKIRTNKKQKERQLKGKWK
ncbi:unnamed protein product [Diabrotica balteata]|uniref:Uncharacterized protein n=1 Tax=Diabrotica balteata TaxID=107213 RepID=A0A9N9SXR1_DIABA|nr:unnamed protein product [Diabrotica balteata]